MKRLYKIGEVEFDSLADVEQHCRKLLVAQDCVEVMCNGKKYALYTMSGKDLRVKKYQQPKYSW